MHHAHMNLRAIGKLRGLTSQAALAELIGVDQTTVHRMEKLHPSVTLRNFLDAAEALDVSLAEIFADDRSEAETELVRQWRSLSRSQQAEWSAHLRLAAGDSTQSGEENSGTGLRKGLKEPE